MSVFEKRANFSDAVKEAVWKRAGGRCESCGNRITLTPHYDHIRPTALSDDGSLSNCQLLCTACHGGKTRKERPAIDKVRNIMKRRMGITKAKRKWPSRGFSKWGVP
jgi:5-methylcytosine-specific restriction endonuclease McrA